MALHLNLLHEQISEQRQRQRDPLKIGMMILGTIGAIMLLFYMLKAYQTLAIKNRLSQVQHDWAKVEPGVTTAQKRSKELNTIIGTTRVLDTMMESRFYWGPLLQHLSRCVAPNAQLTSIEGSVNEDTKVITVSLQGIAAGREPRAAAEELRQLLTEQLGQTYSGVKVEFKSLEDLDTLVKVAGTNMAIARYALDITFKPGTAENIKNAATATASARSPKK